MVVDRTASLCYHQAMANNKFSRMSKQELIDELKSLKKRKKAAETMHEDSMLAGQIKAIMEILNRKF